MAMSNFQRTTYKLLGKYSKGIAEKDQKLEDSLKKAHLPIRGEAYVAWALATTAIAAVAVIAICVSLVFFLPLIGIPVSLPVAMMLIVFPVMITGVTYVTLMSSPASKAKSRGKAIDMKLPYAINYMAAMASAGVVPDKIFASLARQKIYGEIAKESLMIYKDIFFSGLDTITALKRGVERSPSIKLQDFLQGAITTITSGGNLQAYFSSEAQRYMWENRREQKSFIDTMGLMAETYVTVAVAGPLFMIVMMSIMSMLGGEGPNQLMMIIYMLLPVANAGFVFGLQSMIPEV